MTSKISAVLASAATLVWALYAASAAAAPFRAYEFTQPELAARPDLADIIEGPELTTGVTALEKGGTRLFFYAELAEMLARLDNGRGDTPAPAASPVAACRLPTPPVVSFAGRRCARVTRRIEAGFAAANAACGDLAAPERYIETQSLEGYDDSDLETLPGLIKIAGAPLMLVEDTEGLLPPDFGSDFRRILLKIRNDEIDGALRDAARTLERARSALDRGEDCGTHNIRMETKQTLADAWTEVATARDRLRTFHDEGVEAAQADAARVTEAGLCRAELPYPALTDEERVAASMYVSGLYWRMRGAGLWEKKGTQHSRRKYAGAPVAVIAALNGGAAFAEPVGKAMIQRLQYKGWSEWFDMGAHDGADIYSDLVGMTRRGEYQVGVGRYATVGGYSATRILDRNGYDPAPLHVGGLQIGACYYYTRLATDGLAYGADLAPPLFPFATLPSQWGELCAGGAIGLGLAKSLLKGKDCAHRRVYP